MYSVNRIQLREVGILGIFIMVVCENVNYVNVKILLVFIWI